MLADSSNGIQIGSFDSELHLPHTVKHELVNFIARQLPAWRDLPERPAAEGETVLTGQLCDYLSNAAFRSEDWSQIRFTTESADEGKGGRKVDLTPKPLGAPLFIEGRRHSIFDALFPIECKRLPTPKKNNRDEREYVITEPGTTGGIQRFKFGHHGSTHSFGAMIAYVQQGTCGGWLPEVNGWIESLAARPLSAWGESDYLQPVSDVPESGLSLFGSTHPRGADLGEITLRHLWIEMDPR